MWAFILVSPAFPQDMVSLRFSILFTFVYSLSQNKNKVDTN